MLTSLILASQLTEFCEEQRDFAELVMKAQKTVSAWHEYWRKRLRIP